VVPDPAAAVVLVGVDVVVVVVEELEHAARADEATTTTPTIHRLPDIPYSDLGRGARRHAAGNATVPMPP
jgi:hypothetical protein